MGIDWTNLFKKYKSQWVALKKDEKTVLSSGKTAKQAWSKAVRKGHSHPILTRIPNRLVSYIGGQS